jgi:hypothetical protein
MAPLLLPFRRNGVLGRVRDSWWNSQPNGHGVLVVSKGALWSVNPTTRIADEFASAIADSLRVANPEGYVLNNQGLAFMRIGPEGILWRSRRISWDGFADLKLEGEHLRGLAWTPIDNAWIPFVLDIRTGVFEGGSYSGPDMEIGS